MGLFNRLKPSARPNFEKAWHKALVQTDCQLDDVAVKTAHDDVKTRVDTWEHSEDGLTLLRTELMDSVDRALVHHAFLELDDTSAKTVRKQMPDMPAERSELKRLIAANELRIAAIRTWGAMRYNDYAEGDWFDTYKRAAAMRKTGATRDLERLAGDMPAATRNNIDAAVRGLNTSLRLRLAQAPPGKKIGTKSTRKHRLLKFLRRTPRCRHAEQGDQG
jgi:hypothetical protein